MKGYDVTFTQHEKRGRRMKLASLCNTDPAAVKRARNSTLQVRGAKLFNIIPRDLRDTVTGTTDQFKAKLDEWLSSYQALLAFNPC